MRKIRNQFVEGIRLEGNKSEDLGAQGAEPIKEETKANLILEKPEGKPETKNREQKKKFYSGLARKLTALVAAGFVTLGDPFKSTYTEYPYETQKDTSPVGFLSKSEDIDAEVLAKFEKKLKEEEPHFIEWLTEYEKGLARELDEYENKLLEEEYDQNLDIELLRSLWGNSSTDEREDYIQVFKESGPRIKEFIAANHDMIKRRHAVIRENLRHIILAAFFLDGSREVRDNVLLYNIVPPKITFYLYHPYDFIYGLRGRALPFPIKADSLDIEDEYLQGKRKVMPGGNLTPEITITAAATVGDYKTRSDLGLDGYFSTLMHEILHALKYGTKDAKVLLNLSASGIERFLVEGFTQNSNFEILRFLASKNDGLKYQLVASDHILTTVILDHILRTNGSFAVSLVNSRLADEQYFLNSLSAAVKKLGLSGGIVDDMKRLNDDNFVLNSDFNYALITAADLLARLDLSGVEISEKSIGSVFTGRSYNTDVAFEELRIKTKEWFNMAEQRKKYLRDENKKKHARY
ncbi:MAG: hypothetical protein A3J46_02480 [Candidatus Yanofskybacteria bacterium RIFCSPHIGHO2_02_FULL_41_11]|uniref:Uncharacterized protein n=1 Tax=Candidatus Yanofskybacteria bacterium RIFCSPHIGHO2_02_FULL_41_11 TaxID=1802675 RepID=A0A1F8F6Y0_9BACT|nr:MAG: hypothetical protein A3J46_02480 [Candidatus Yanofskybacteria bacterium RIFCSPHIGHO2_02_FULL_41_11]